MVARGLSAEYPGCARRRALGQLNARGDCVQRRRPQQLETRAQ